MFDVLDEMGLSSASYASAVALYASTYEQYIKAMELYKKAGESPIIKTHNGSIVQHPLLGVINRCRVDMRRLIVEFGMTPSSRSSVVSEKRPSQIPVRKRG